MRARIHIVIGGHLCMSPRGQREAAVLQEAGYEVTVSGVAFDAALSRLDREIMRRQRLRFAPAVEITGQGLASTFRRLAARTSGRLARERFRRQGAFTPDLLGYGTSGLLQACLEKKADLTIVHSETGLWLGGELLNRGRRVGVDFEDWFSQDLPVEKRRDRPVGDLARLEREMLHRASYRLASSRVMARALAAAYGATEPAVATNALSWPEGASSDNMCKDRTSAAPVSLHWFSQTIGPSRGLELLFDALPLLRQPVQVSLRGQCGPAARSWLARVLPEKHRSRVTLLAPVPPWKLALRLVEHDIGLALETDLIPSRDLCLSNKFFHYLQAGLAVIATGTQGQREGLARCPGAGLVLKENFAGALAEAIDAYAQDEDRLQAARASARQAAAEIWNGESDRAAILTEAAQALAT